MSKLPEQWQTLRSERSRAEATYHRSCERVERIFKGVVRGTSKPETLRSALEKMEGAFKELGAATDRLAKFARKQI